MIRKISERLVKSRIVFEQKPVIPYLEFHVTDHCNLNCKGCSHFSPIADKIYLDVNEHRKDIQQLTKLVSNIKVIRLLGGEPLLHPKITDFITITKTSFPNSEVHIVTNGILLPTMSDFFWRICRENSICVDLTIYPPFLEKEKEWSKIIRSHKVKAIIAEKKTFSTMMNSKGDSYLNKETKKCIYPGFAMVRQGKLFNCWMPALVHYFNSYFNESIPNKNYLEIHDPNINGWDILAQIEKDSETCKYCTARLKRVPFFEWQKSFHEKTEWDTAVIEITKNSSKPLFNQ